MATMVLKAVCVQSPQRVLRNPKPQTLNPKPQTLNPKPQTLNPKPQTLNPKPLTPLSSPSDVAEAVKMHSAASRDLCFDRLVELDVRSAEASYPADKDICPQEALNPKTLKP